MAAGGKAGAELGGTGPLAGLHIALLVPWASRLGGGVASVVQLQAQLIRRAGGQVTVLTLADQHTDEDRGLLDGVPLEAVRMSGPGFVRYGPDLIERLLATGADLLHLHGIWLYPSRAATAWARRTGKPYVISPHGMLDPWITARGRWKKALARRFYERPSWRRADAFHALTRNEAADIAREAGAGRVLTIPNAGPPAVASAAANRAPKVLYLGRIHPKKNLGELIDGWAEASLPEGSELVIAGWGDPADRAAFDVQMREAPASVKFVGPAHGEAKRKLLEEARFVILPSHSEGLPMTILEAWAAGTPTIMTQACHLPEGFAAGAAIECRVDSHSIEGALEQALRMDEPHWRAMSDAALSLARGEFSADTVSLQWCDAYRSLAAGPDA